ncbi:MAG TPA: thiamine pyrophosphate-binding protein [Acidimicrobiia bacterium]|nr:thiamine pyrophosphate-binding protein [Acidimicrobiia bacterium]
MNVSEAVGRTLVERGVRQVFGVVGSGNFHVTNAMVDAGARFVAARHEGGAATMTDAYGRMSGEVAVLSVHQGCGLTNAMTGITEAAKSRTPMVVVAAQATQPRSNFYVDQEMLAMSVGAVPLRIGSADSAVADAAAAVDLARRERRTVLLNLPLDIQGDEVENLTVPAPMVSPDPMVPSDDDLNLLVEALEGARRPVFVAGRGSRGPGCRQALADLAEATGALLATSAVAKGLFNGNEWYLDVSGGFSSPLAAGLIKGADLIVGWGCALNMWTMRHGRLIGEGARVIQVDDDPDAIGAHRPMAQGVVGDVRATAEAALSRVGEPSPGYRSEDVRRRIASEIRWRDVPYEENSTGERIDARTLSITLDDLLPEERIVSIDSGNFMGHPSMYLSVPDEWGFCFTQAFQSIGLGLATAIGAALAQPDRLPVAALGDGGGLMSIAEMETVVRLGLPMVVVVYNDEAYGAEVHHFGPDGHDLDIVQFPPTDIAAIARGFGFEALTVREKSDLDPVEAWVAGDRARPLLIDAKVTSQASWWLEEAFGH